VFFFALKAKEPLQLISVYFSIKLNIDNKNKNRREIKQAKANNTQFRSMIE